MSLSKAWVMFCMASFCALALIVVASPATFASAKQQAIAQDNCPLLEYIPSSGYMSTDANSNGMVTILQERLIAVGDEGDKLGTSGPQNNGVDGYFGPMTQAAVIDFQKKNGLRHDGIVWNETWAALGGCTTPPPPSKCVTNPNAC